MSALGHKQTYAPQKAMSALASIATEKADFHKRSCLLYPRKPTCAAQTRMSAKGQKQTLRCFSYNLPSVASPTRTLSRDKLPSGPLRV